MFGRWKRRAAETQDPVPLLKASLRGDTQAFGAIVGQYQSLVCAITYGGTGNVERSEELAQETFLKAWKSLGQLQDLDKFRPWLCSIARSTVQNWFRSRHIDVVHKAAPLDTAMEKASEEAGPEEAAIMQEQQAVVARALAQIPEALREPLILFYREQKSTQEVARQLGLSETAARQRIARGRTMLREQVAAVVETAISRTKPGKAFTSAVIAVIAASAVKTTTTAAAATGVAAAVAGSSGVTTILSPLAAKALALAAGVVIVAGGVIAYRHMTRPEQAPVVSTAPGNTQMGSGDRGSGVGGDQPATRGNDLVATTANPDSALRNPNAELAASTSERDRTPIAAAAPPAKPFEFAPRGVLSGVITDIDTGEPVRDARVQISISWWAEARTDANGFYSFNKVKEAGNYQIAVYSLEYVGIARDNKNPAIYLSNDKQAVKHLQLPKACMVDVYVTDANGAPLPEASVIITSLADDRSREIGDSSRSRPTDPNGYLLLGGIPPAPADYLITVTHYGELKAKDGVHVREPDFAPAGAVVQLTDPNVIKEVQVVLPRGQDVHGYAEYSDGVPARDIGIEPTPVWWHSNYSAPHAPVDADGTFTLKHIAPGVYNIGMYVPRPDKMGGTMTTVGQAQLPPEDGQVFTVRLPGKSPQSLASISGRFVFAGGKKPDNVSISAYSPSGGSAYADVMRDTRGQLGDTFVLNRLEPGTYTLRFSGTNVEEKVLTDVAAPSEGIEVELVYVDKPQLTGTVVDKQTGKPVKAFRVRARKLQTTRGPNYVQPDQWVHIQNEQGQFSVETVGPGVYQVQAAAEGYATLWSEEKDTDLAAPVTLALSTGGSITGTVVNSSGEPVDGAKVIPLSLAGGAMPPTRDTFTSQDGAVIASAGSFTLRNLPPGVETLKVTHPDYAFAVAEDIRVAEGKTTEGVRITLTSGAAVEGCVYDDRGVPQAAQALYFQDAGGYSGSDDRAAGLLATAVTDSNGFYRVAHLPETFCYVSRGEEWNCLGVVRRVVMPKDGVTTRLDFGGAPAVSGVVVIDGVPLAGARVLLGPTDSPHFGAFRCFAKTDPQGAFAFTGAVPGTHAVYYERPEKRGDWLRIATVAVAAANVELGVIPGDNVGRLLVTLNTSGPASAWTVRSLALCDDGNILSPSLRTAAAPAEAGRPWVIDNVEPGQYVLTVTREDDVQWRKPVELAPAQGQWQITLDLPRADAKLTGRLLGAASRGAALWREDKAVFATILPAEDGRYAVEGLPAGRYRVGDNLALVYNVSPAAEFELGDGETRMLDLDLSATPKREVALLIVRIINEAGTPQSEARVTLDGPLGTIEPVQSTPLGRNFLSVPGDHVLHIEAPGCKPVHRAVTLKVTTPAGVKSQTLAIRLEKQ